MSFGTEDRPCERPVGPRSEVYEHIAFRGRDLVDLQIIPPLYLDDDPSIVSAELEHSPVSKSKPQGDIDGPDDLWGRNSVFSGVPKSEPPISSMERPSAPVFPNFMSPKPPADLLADIPLNPWGSLGGRLSGEGDRASTTNATSSTTTTATTSKKEVVAKVPSSISPTPTKTEDGGKATGSKSRGVQSNRGFRPTYSNNQRHGSRPHNDSYDEGRGPGTSGTAISSQPSGSRGGYSQKQRHWGPSSKSRAVNVDFKEEYDMEKANAELAEVLEKIDIASSRSTGSEPGEEKETGKDDAYDSSKSFFDTLSSELMDRAQGIVNRHSRREDRKHNFDTFGPAAHRIGVSFRGGGFRGRRGGGGQYRGQRGVTYGGPKFNKQTPNRNTESGTS
ncbi:unnamed protein product [Mesocestoides corti]|nr:unnamed protein product [Mesocestoides corti]